MHTAGYIYSKAIKTNEIFLSVSLQLPLSGASLYPEAADVREEKEEDKEEDMEEQERVNALLQRKKLLQDLGVVDQIHQLLQGRTEGGGVLQDAKDACTHHQQSKLAHQRQQQTKVRLTPITCSKTTFGLKLSLFCCLLIDYNFACFSLQPLHCFSFISVGLFDTVFPKDKAAVLQSDVTAGTSAETQDNTHPVKIIQYF